MMTEPMIVHDVKLDRHVFLEELYNLLSMRYKFDQPLQDAIANAYIMLRKALDDLEANQK